MSNSTKKKISIRIDESLLNALKLKYQSASTTEVITSAIMQALEPNYDCTPKKTQLFPIIGSKGQKLRKVITQAIDATEHTTFVDVFGGSGVILLNKTPSKIEVYNDINNRLVNLLEVVKNKPTEFLIKAQNIVVSESKFNIEKNKTEFTSNIDDAVNYFFLSTTSIYGHRKTLATNINPNIMYRNKFAQVQGVSDRLKDVVLLNKDFRKIIKMYNREDTLLYLDPPYYSKERYYNYPFTYQDHLNLSKLLKEFKGKFILSYYSNSVIYSLYRSRRLYHKAIRYKRQSGNAKQVTDKIITNFEFDGSKKFT